MQIYVGNLNYTTTVDDLKSLFSSQGEVVSAKIISDRDTGRSKGFGFIEMADKNAAISAIEELDGKELDGRNLRVNEAQRKSGGGGGGNYNRDY